MSEELPDLTPYLSKKGGNQSNKGPAEAASKPELSQKLSALVKKPAASSHNEPQVPSSPSLGGAAAGDTSANSIIPIIRPVTSSSTSYTSLEAAQSQSVQPQANSTPAPHSLQGAGESISGVQSTRALGGKPAVSPVERLRAPQARPISSLSSGNAAPPHLLKAPGQQLQPERSASPRVEVDNFQAVPRGGSMESVAPSSPSPSSQLPAISSPRSLTPLQMPTKPVVRASEAPSAQGQSQVGTASSSNLSRSVAPLQMPAGFAGSSGATGRPQPSAASLSSQPAASVQEPGATAAAPVPSSSMQGLDAKAMLARAFQEEQRALEKEQAAAASASKNFADLFNQESKLLSEQSGAGFSPESDINAALYSESDHLPQRSVGIGNLLGGTNASIPPQHTAFSDLMTRTGEHDVRFAPERREELSSFDEVKSSIQAAITPAVSPASPVERAPDRSPESSAFNLFSTEIVTSGQDYHTRPEPEGGDFGVGMRDSDSTYPAASAAVDRSADDFKGLSESSSQVLANYTHGLAESTSSSGFGEFSAEASSQFSPESYEQSAPSPFQQFGAAFPMQPASESFGQFEAEVSQEPEPSLSVAPVAPTAGETDPSSFDPNAFNIQVADPAQADAAREVMAQLMAFQTGGSQSQAVQSLDQLKAAIKAKKDEEARAQEMEAEFNRQQQQRALQDSDQLEAPTPAPVVPVVQPVAEDDQSSQRAKLIAMIEQSNQAKLDAVEGTERAVNASVPEPEGALGRALSNALDKLLGEDDTPFGAAPVSAQVEANPVVVAQAPAQTSFESETTVKADALARLLEVASKAPSKTPEANKAKSSAINLAEIINKPPGKVSRQMEAAQISSGNPESMASPFGGNSPYTSPFGGGGSMASDSSNNPNASGQNLNAGYTSQPGSSYPGYSSAGSQQASMSSDAVSARMADLNRKLQEQRTKPVVTSSQTVEAMSPTDLPPLSSNVGVGSSPSINSLSQIPAMDEEMGSKAELVNRILGQARISGASAAPPASASVSNLPKSSADYMGADQAAAVRNIKPQAAKTHLSSRSRMAGPGIHPAVIGLVVFLVLGIVGGGGYYLYQSGILKGDLPKGVGSVEKSIDALIKDGEYDQAIASLEAKQKGTKLTSSELDKLYSTYINQAERLAKEDEEFGKAVALLEKVPSKTKRYKEAQKMLRKYRKKVKKN